MIELQEPHWWQQVPVLDSSVLQVREVEARDTPSLYELLTDPRVTQHISTPPGSLAAFEGFVAWAHRQREAGTCVCFSVVPHGLQHAIGIFQVRALEPTFRIADWGFALGAPFWSTGIFQEAAILVAEFAFKTIGVHRLEARAVVENTRGNRALEKLGAKGEAALRNSFNRTHKQFLWAIVAEEWSPPKVAERAVFDAAKLKSQIARAVEQQLFRTEQARTSASPTPFPFFLTDSSKQPPDR
jgi:RimJ/RimL family protein N-acetyltransferase